MSSTKKPRFGLFKPAKQNTKKPSGKKKPQKKQTTDYNVTGTNTTIQTGASKLGRILSWVVIVLLAIGAGCGFLAFNRHQEAPVAQSKGADAKTQQAGAYAANFVGAWLDATSTDSEELDKYYTGSNGKPSGKDPVEYRDLTVASVDEKDDHLVTVVLTADVKNTSGSGKDEKTTWTPFWYQTVIEVTDSGNSPIGYPEPIAGPKHNDPPELGYGSRVTNEDLEQAVSDFFAAYATGKGDVTRYSSPDSDINAISPAWWDEARVRSIQSTEKIPDGKPENGKTAKVIVSADLVKDETNRPADYALTLKARDGRWEVATIDSAPTIQKSTETK